MGACRSLIESMTRPPNLANMVLAGVVWLTLPVLAASALLLPVQRLIAEHWPEPLVEWVDADGGLELRSGSQRMHDDAVPRSRPINAARIDLGRQPPRYGYVVGLRRDGQELDPPTGRWWRPGQDCELALSDVDRPEQVQWFDCAEIVRVAWPNRLAALDRLLLAGVRIQDRRRSADGTFIPGVPAQDRESTPLP